MDKIETIKKMAQSKGFDDCYLLPMEGLNNGPYQRAICLLIKGYTPFLFSKTYSKGEIDAYYLAAQKSFIAAKELALTLSAAGFEGEHTTNLLIKPLLSQLGDFVQLKSTLHAHVNYGTYFHVQTIIVNSPLALEKEEGRGTAPLCKTCRLCEKACPTGAIDRHGYSRAKCLRSYMLCGSPVPIEMRAQMGMKLLGCDICQRVCPYNQKVAQNTNTQEGEADIEALLTLNKEVVETLEAKIGKNMTIANRIRAQACLLAANTGNQKYIKILEKLTVHPSPVVREHALWAVKQLTNEA